MLVSQEKLRSTYRKVKQIKEHMKAYSLAPDRAKLSVEDLQWCISDFYGVTIEKIEVDFEGDTLRGLIERYESSARILVRAGQGEEWMRFTTVKELCHILIDEREDWSPAGHDTIDSMLLEDFLDEHETEETAKARKLAAASAQSEKLAVIAATELMYPHEYREADVRSIAEGKTTLKAIALHFHVPVYVVGSAHHPGRMELARKGWQLANS
ncbi:hypothetical protein JQ574_22630 [Bradyrhizobium sp. AUGA SZCCT0158]|uniref:hypothetical protein n=1 Tax=Bradyrhizobium sp. AUGA SZCCT0158 TaxID=2807661 RepID=UPI001BA4C631|nr:hypothetical protein [Bradyrhizobium sp. AUGA SZCCT0158]MBR1198796.1 hypothetical protein [Bradyrhizobium sp. AUGA SZCCT0158]